MARKGKSLERLVAALERALANDPETEILTNARVRDRVTGRLREHDVLVRRTGRHDVIIAFECRDRIRPVGVPAVESFWAKCERTVDKGILVSGSGFSKTALQDARVRNIGCLTLEEAERFEWMQALHFTIRHVSPVNPRLKIDTPKQVEQIAEVHHRLFGRIDQGEKRKQLINACWFAVRQQHQPEWPFPALADEPRRYAVRLNPSDFYAIDINGAEVPVTFAAFTCDVEVVDEYAPVKFMTYGSPDDPENRFSVASSAFGLRQHSGEVIMVQNADDEIVFLARLTSKESDAE